MFFRAHSPLKPHILFYSNGLATWYGFPDITHFKVDNCRKSAIFNLIDSKFVRTYPFLKPHLLFNSNGLAIWHDVPVIKHSKVKSGRRWSSRNFHRISQPETAHIVLAICKVFQLLRIFKSKVAALLPFWIWSNWHFHGISLPKPHILFDSNSLAIWQGFPVITHIEVRMGRRSAIMNLIKLNFLMVYPYLKLHILFNSNVYSETQVSGRLGMSGGISPRHAQNPLSGERRKTLSITHHALSPHPHIIICTSFISSIDYNVFIVL